MRTAVIIILLSAAAAVTGGGTAQDPNVDEQTLRAAGLGTDDAKLLEFFQERVRVKADGEKLLAWARQLGDKSAQVQTKAAAQLISSGAPAIPALRHVLNDLDDPGAAEGAQRCLEWLEGSRRGEVPIAAARLLAARKPAGAVEAMLAYLPFADDATVVDGVKAALVALIAGATLPEPALVAALRDPVPLRRAIAVEVLCSNGRLDVLADVRKLLADPKPQVRLRAALALVDRLDEEAINVLINLLADLPLAQRRQAEEALQQLAGEWSPNPALAGDDEVSRKIRRDAWAAWWRNTDGPTLLAAFHKRTLSPDDLALVQTLIDKLGDKSFAARERAAADLIFMGSKVVPLLKEAKDSTDLERAQRAQNCLKQIAVAEDKSKLPPAAARLLALRRPAGATDALLAFIPFTDDESLSVEITRALKHLSIVAGKPEPALIKALGDPNPRRRAAAGEALASAGAGEHFPALRKLLADPDSRVRLRVAVALAYAREKEAVPALIDLIADLPKGQAWEAEELLYRLAAAKAPPAQAGDDPAARQKFKEAWHAWWKENAATVNLAPLEAAPVLLGFTLIAEFSQNNANGGRVVEVDRAGKIRWQIENLGQPTDAQFLPGNRVLIAEGTGSRVTERDLKGTIIWQYICPGYPTNVQRLANGNTFIAVNGGSLLEVDRNGKLVHSINVLGNLRAAYRMSNGETICLTNNLTCVRLDKAGKQIKSFNLTNPNGYTSGIDVTPKGNILVTQNNGFVAEHDPDGKIVWQAKTNPTCPTATRLPNGHTLVASYNQPSVVELDGTGRTVWEYRAVAGFTAFRARQR